MFVFVVSHQVGYDGDVVVAVFDSHDKAVAFVDSCPHECFAVKELRLNEVPEEFSAVHDAASCRQCAIDAQDARERSERTARWAEVDHCRDVVHAAHESIVEYAKQHPDDDGLRVVAGAIGHTGVHGPRLRTVIESSFPDLASCGAPYAPHLRDLVEHFWVQ
jgi:hypothetical protein